MPDSGTFTDTLIVSAASVVAANNPTREALSAIENALDNERCKLGSFEDLLSTLTDGAASHQPNPFYALLNYVESITKRLVQIGDQLDAVGNELAAQDPSSDRAVIATEEFRRWGGAYSMRLQTRDGTADEAATYEMLFRAALSAKATTPHGSAAKLRAMLIHDGRPIEREDIAAIYAELAAMLLPRD